MPTFTRTAAAFWSMIESGELPVALYQSNIALFWGYLIALSVAVPLGIAMGSLPIVRKLVIALSHDPPVDAADRSAAHPSGDLWARARDAHRRRLHLRLRLHHLEHGGRRALGAGGSRRDVAELRRIALAAPAQGRAAACLPRHHGGRAPWTRPRCRRHGDRRAIPRQLRPWKPPFLLHDTLRCGLRARDCA